MSVLKSFLMGGQGMASVDRILADLTLEGATRRFEGLPYTVYDLIWHIELCQNLLLQGLAEEQSEIRFPPASEQWPQNQPDEEAFEDLISRVRAGVYEASELAGDPEDLSERDREILEDIAAHNAYHWGQVVVLRRLLGSWPGKEQGA
ncbi:hypothetical protein [Deinococcus peraridilitoris]|uniref:DinB-like domain-containing protein n=1 Tax=Deinococcus peraridilitoris (strain DSM 19664 / LMG 22246 / CIP 109416 / KR-200) TaxID=937777 RepID=L0A308_DEIPD|nr:hypothetical protein [Deinococcus peraridilitoris]AFZ68221.1 hypothetical protein Deipe_2757 [Deinococcus peraridilitoris DSM 19664]